MVSPSKPAPLSPSKLNNGGFKPSNPSPGKRGVSEQPSLDSLTTRYDVAVLRATCIGLGEAGPPSPALWGPLPQIHTRHDTLLLAGSDSPPKARRIKPTAKPGATVRRRWRTSSRKMHQSTRQSRRRRMMTAVPTRRTAIRSGSGRRRGRLPAAASPRAGARVATSTAACQPCRTSRPRQVCARWNPVVWVTGREAGS